MSNQGRACFAQTRPFTMFVLLILLWAHQRKQLGFSECLAGKESEQSFTKTKPTRRWHTVLKHLNKLPVRHHRFFVACFKESLLDLKTLALIDRIIELAIPSPNFTTSNNRLEHLNRVSIFSSFS